MLAYLTLGTNDKEKAFAFYDAVLGEMGAKRFFANDRLQFYGVAPGQPMFAIGTETVDRVYKKAREMGAPCEGEPGQRLPTFYGAYFRDPDGNKICVCKLG
ncbi:MAG: glyoxalase [Hyphomonas sp. 34-62-18]|nr:VOC family protein [Hyphomonas sp. 34-62-18]OZB16853.1 MAG: glyoxalase [Hyphomonas sp. 34-62-18]